MHGQHLPADAVHAHRDPGDRRGEPQSDHGLRRHGELRPRRLSRHRRLCRSAFSPTRASRPASCNGRWRSSVSALFALVIGAFSLRTRGVYFIMITLAFAQMIYYVGVGLDRYGGDDGLTIYAAASSPGSSTSPTRRRSTISASPCCSASLSGLAPRQFALRHGDPGRPLERPAHARDRLPDLSLPARLLRDRRHDLRPGRRAARQSHRLHQPGDDALDALRRPHRHGGARRHGHVFGRSSARSRFWCSRRRCLSSSRRRAEHSSSRGRWPRGNIGRSSWARCCCSSCCSRAAASTACSRGSRRG